MILFLKNSKYTRNQIGSSISMIVCSSANLRGQEVSCGARLDHAVHVDHVGFEGNFRQASRALDVEAINAEAEVILIFHNLLASVEILSLGNIFVACVAFHVEWSHETDGKLPVLGLLSRRDLGRNEIRLIAVI